MSAKGLVERLRDGDSLVVAEGYIFEFERKGYLKAGSFVPEVVVEHPELVRAQHLEYVHAGSDVVLAFTYYAHREKLRLIGREDDIEAVNMKALKIAREVADETGTLMAGNICNTTVYMRDNPVAIQKARGMNKEQIEWAVKGGADFILGETYMEFGEAMLVSYDIFEMLTHLNMHYDYCVMFIILLFCKMHFQHFLTIGEKLYFYVYCLRL